MIRKTARMLARVLRSAIRLTGLDVVRWGVGRPLYRRKLLMDKYGIDLVLDVGANAGQYADELRRIGYRGRIASFEPGHDAYARLVGNSAKDPLWTTYPVALGSAKGTGTLNIASNNVSSSMLPFVDEGFVQSHGFEFVGTNTVQIETLDSLLPAIDDGSSKIMLKIDAQGFEREILSGAVAFLQRISLVQVEAALKETYRGCFTASELFAFMAGHGFMPVSVEYGWTSPSTGQMYEIDVLFSKGDPADMP